MLSSVISKLRRLAVCQCIYFLGDNLIYFRSGNQNAILNTEMLLMRFPKKFIQKREIAILIRELV